MADSIRVSIPSARSDDAGEDSMGPHAADDSAGSGDTTVQSRPQKRRRIPVACGACRSKKSRVSKAEHQNKSRLTERQSHRLYSEGC